MAMEKRGVVDGEVEEPRDKQAADAGRKSLGDDLPSKLAEAVPGGITRKDTDEARRLKPS
jgi:hypothetical protein